MRVEVVGDAGSVAEAVERDRAIEHPDVVLLDVHMPDGGGVEVIGRVGRRAARERAFSRCRSPTPPRT